MEVRLTTSRRIGTPCGNDSKGHMREVLVCTETIGNGSENALSTLIVVNYAWWKRQFIGL